MHFTGFHHLTAVTADAEANHRFYTQVLGLRLVKKTVNQDDVSAYHLFYGDGAASPGSDITFFDWPVPPERRGGRSVVRTGFRVDSEASLEWWAKRFVQMGVKHLPIAVRDGRSLLDFEDAEGQRMSLVAEVPRAAVHPWERSPVPAEHQLRGLGPITMSVPELAGTEAMLTRVLSLRLAREYSSRADSREVVVKVFEMGPAVAGRTTAACELHVQVDPTLRPARSGAGGVHHVAFRTTREEYQPWYDRLREFEVPSSGPVDRFYFRSLYFREPSGVLFEIATDEPGFAADEPLASLGERLSLPPFLEARRAEIEAGLRPL